MPEQLYVRMEAVNLANFVEDVHDLSTIRGGSFLLLEAVGAVQKEVSLSPVSTGASAGLFSLVSDEQPELIRERIERFLHADARFRHATFVVDVRRDTQFAETREALTAMNRWRQFQQPTVAIPSPPPRPSNTECEYDHVRPAVEKIHLTKDETRWVSRSVSVRRKHGRERKQDFYASELGKLRSDSESGAAAEGLDDLIGRVADASFVNDLETLTSGSPAKRLDLKMAVVYFDGNKFGALQRACGTPSDLQRLDRTIKTCRRQALRALLERIFASRDNSWWTQDDDKEAVRLETLLWGGDELVWVVPAWKGWEVVRLFYEVTKSCMYGDRPLTHAGGIVFCHRGAPIHRMRGIAHRLADLCKKRLDATKPPDTHAARDLFAYQIFESADLSAGSLETFRRGRVPLTREAQAEDDLLVYAEEMDSVAADLDAVRRTFPRSKLHDIVLMLRDPQAKTEDITALIDTTVNDLDAGAREALGQLFRFFGRTNADPPWQAAPTGWFHIADLWDYALA